MDSRTPAQSDSATAALKGICSLQDHFVHELEILAKKQGHSASFQKVSWLREQGKHGGGVRYVAPEDSIFNRGSVNMSQVHYDDLPEKKLGSASALSTIIHPQSPHLPSVHMHISWTEMKGGRGYWRIMADLNPAIERNEDREDFEAALRQFSGSHYGEGTEQGAQYFFIPALNRHRGVSHFYLEGYHTDSFSDDLNFAMTFGKGMIDCYVAILDRALSRKEVIEDDHRKQQRDYHTLYFYQVLTLDRGTTSGLLVHDQNDVGILGSLPSHIDRHLFASWASKTEAPQDELVRSLLDALPSDSICSVDEPLKASLAKVIRKHYREHPQGIDKQAKGKIVPPTVSNHS
ncbi:coproporphyrinogen III oxidase [Pseudobacteriovorax antillogorgiicola]|uniref:coproporphyrinogen oxidase n=1 Tax=Pseudobacteriovorax antillogorgiicola TaxID=1513793 RepID=A0A1Y6CIU2_9BACT|nr:coproporphyrinogen III oxidase [Pseudobacteriovorax antillogorgiicola]TCS47907.1 coproporphyrinogen oxidase [Pseudobacteriovorax antillogorgiicola]SMF57826.1 coproporphyrinogen oxidase [Pseudobacteriovorax antillogorgiicola]